jgi:hypothetical protein
VRKNCCWIFKFFRSLSRCVHVSPCVATALSLLGVAHKRTHKLLEDLSNAINNLNEFYEIMELNCLKKAINFFCNDDF